jgi:Cu/Ag efflux protein CusF/mono/diheme cytochrome c family protein
VNRAGLAVLAAAALQGTLSPQTAFAHAQITTTVEFDREIVRVLDNHCVACHIDNGPAFPLVTYEQTYRARWQIRQDALTRHMAPWAAVPGYGDFVNDNSLTQREIDFVTSWAESFGPRNNGAVYAGSDAGAAAPKPVEAHGDFITWAQGTPDLLLSLPAHAVAPQPVETVYRTVIDPGLKSERWLSGLEYQPRDRRWVHAAVFTVQETGQWLASWTPWHGFVDLPDGLAYRLPAGSHIAAEIHYYGATQPITEHGSLGLYFVPHASARLLADQILNAKSRPAAIGDSRILEAMTDLKEDTNVLALQPQLRAGVQSIEISARKPDGATQLLLFARDIPLEWPTPYVFRKPVSLSKGTRLSVIEHYAANVPVPEAGVAVTLSTYQGDPLPSEQPQAQPPAVAVQRFKLDGTVKSVDAAQRRVVVAHGDIPGYMSAMTMAYAVGKQEDLQKIAAGDRIRSDVVVNDSGAHLENIEVTGR